MSVPDRRAMLDRKDGKLSIRRQCHLLGIARSGVYRPPRAANDNDLGLMRRLDELFTQWPFLGSRRLATMLRDDGHAINRKRVQRLMRQMGIAALGPKPRTKGALIADARARGDNGEARRAVEGVLQTLLGYLREHGAEDASPPPENVVVFDEAQRAWDA